MLLREKLRLESHTAAAPSSCPATVKYFGKWPFRRVAGMQEVASVVFSLANFLAQAHCLLRFIALLLRLSHLQPPTASVERTDASGDQSSSPPLPQPLAVRQTASVCSRSRLPSADRQTDRGAAPSLASSLATHSSNVRDAGDAGRSHVPQMKQLPQMPPVAAKGNERAGTVLERLRMAAIAYPWWPLWLTYFGTSLLAWAASGLFHTRDVRTTEAADYMLADAFILWGFLTTAIRVTGLQRWTQWVPLILAGGAAYTWHWHRMLTQLFDYGFNVLLCIVLGALQSLVWGVWVGKVHHVARHRMWLFLGLINAATALEVFDFAPWWDLVDAHALWHAATVPLSYVFWGFLQQDMLSYASQSKASAPASL